MIVIVCVNKCYIKLIIEAAMSCPDLTNGSCHVRVNMY